ncbi:MAG TPA: phosphoribosylanthranilate isomerase, partial [Trueperaceae bacterium]|nr:phosphoribosylanthranilate isomerase [Trueperaceae bacterium]
FKIIKAFSFTKDLDIDSLYDYPADSILLDGINPGSGQAFSWQDAKALAGFPNLILAGGLSPDNVGEAIKVLSPYAVDVSSAVEDSKGNKDPDKIVKFINAAKQV